MPDEFSEITSALQIKSKITALAYNTWKAHGSPNRLRKIRLRL
jgi:hypothetical protein